MVDVAPSPTPLTVDEYKEAAERRSAEIELVISAYSPDEVCISKDNLIINRRLNLSFSDDGDGGAVVQVNLTLKLPHVDHMNDPKRYYKWLKKTCQAQGCALLIRQVYKEDNKPDSDDKTTTITKRQQQSLSEYLENNLHQSSRL